MTTKFCFPVRIQLQHRDYLMTVIMGLHLLAVLVLLPWFGKGVFLVGFCIIIMSVRYFIWQQRVLMRYDALIGDDLGRWHLEGMDGERCAVKFEGVLFLGRLGLVSIRRYGALSYWLTHDLAQQKDQWHRLRVFSAFYLRNS